ncbi:MAG: F0F1 ATP synthase subunit A [Desulfohalobiaceae bacterium]|nr:F0F1 ATP synthase subunit A [Desulfohalobiaceae bacterium]
MSVQIAPHVVLLEKLMHAVGLVEEGHIMIPNHILYTWLVMLALIVLAWVATRKITLVPKGVQNFWEIVIGGLEDFVVSTMGENGRTVFPLLMTIFIFILFANFIGLAPGGVAPTANLNTNAAMAIVVFIFYNIVGIKAHGFKYVKQFTGPVPWLTPLILPIEILSHLARPLSLTVRLFGNIFGEELVLILFFALLPVIATLPMYFLYTLVDTIQAFIFFMLSMIYLKLAFEEAH